MYPFLSDIKQRAFAQSALEVAKSDFECVKELGRGEAGRADLYKYVGSNGEIKQYTANDMVVVKSYLNGVDWKEVTNIQYMNSRESAESANFYPKQNAILMDGKVKIISEWVSYGDNKSSDLNKFAFDLGNNLNFNPFEVALLAAQVFFHDMSKAIVENSYFFHSHLELIHFDLAARNVVVAAPYVTAHELIFKAKNTDVGLSSPIGEGSHTFVYPEKEKPKLPYINSSSEIAVNTICHLENAETAHANESSDKLERQKFGKQTVTPFTDIFARKATIFEMLGSFMGYPGEHILFIKGALNAQQMIDCRKEMTDEDVLNNYFENAKSYALRLMKRDGAYDGRGEAVFTFLNHFKSYLTSMPDRSLPYLEASKNDHDFFMTHYAGYRELKREYLVDCTPMDLANKIMPGIFVSHTHAVSRDESSDTAARYNEFSDDEMLEAFHYENEDGLPPCDIEGEREFPLFRFDAGDLRNSRGGLCSSRDSLCSSRDSLRASQDSLRGSWDSIRSSRDSIRSSQNSVCSGSNDGYATDKESGSELRNIQTQSPQVSPYVGQFLFKPQGSGYVQGGECAQENGYAQDGNANNLTFTAARCDF